MQFQELPFELYQISASNLKSLIDEVGQGWLPPEKISTIEWLEKHFRIPSEDSDNAGLYSADYVPYFWGIAYAMDSEAAWMVILVKAAQIGWTLLETGWLCKQIDCSPSRILALFPKQDAGREWVEDKFEPCVRETPKVAKLVDLSTRKSGNRTNKKNFPGGSLSVVGSNSPSNVKSKPAPVVIVEEPDDTNTNVGDQGDAIRLARERVKRFTSRKKFILGGTPSVEGVSQVAHYSSLSTQRVLPIRCHDCGEYHVLDWENVRWAEREDGVKHEVFGSHLPETALYCCPECGSAWDDWQRKKNIMDTCKDARDSGDPWCGWVATADNGNSGVEGFKDLSELYVCIPGTSLADVVRDYLEAEHEAEKGEESARIVFQNSKLAKPYRYSSKDALDAEALEALAEDYPELVCPEGGLIVTAGVDVQDDRVAVVIRAFGRNEESWLMYWGELVGNTVDKKDPVYDALEKVLFGGFEHEKYRKIYLNAVTIDSSDGGTNEAVYTFVRTRSVKYRKVQIMAGKGSSHDYGKKEIFSLPRKKDHVNPKRRVKADKHGLSVYEIGTHKAKDVIAKRLSGTSAFMHSCKHVRPDYWEQVTAEIKAPSKRVRGVLVWQPLASRRNEGLDCEVYALHAAHALRIPSYTPKKWDVIEARFAQSDLFAVEQKVGESSSSSEDAETTTKPRKRAGMRPRRSKFSGV